MPFATEIGLIAPLALLSAFALLNFGKLTADHYTYQWLNAIGAGALAYSVLGTTNYGVLVTEVLWSLIGLFGVIKIFVKRRKATQSPSTTATN